MEIFKLSSFSYNKIGGNEAGVVLDADNLTDKEMLDIAIEVNYSETAFLMKSEIANYKLRYFTTIAEVDLCGHATVATFNLLRNLNLIAVGDYSLETKAGVLEIKVLDDFVFMTQKPAELYDNIEKSEIENCFKSFDDCYVGDLPIQIVSTGLRDILLQVKNNEVLNDLEPDLEEINKLTEKYDTVGIHVFSLEEISENIINVRNFAPRFGIPEESATGTSNGALVCYLLRKLNRLPSEFTIFQGFAMNKLSRIKVQIEKDNKNDKVKKVYIGGTAREIRG